MHVVKRLQSVLRLCNTTILLSEIAINTIHRPSLSLRHASDTNAERDIHKACFALLPSIDIFEGCSNGDEDEVDLPTVAPQTHQLAIAAFAVPESH